MCSGQVVIVVAILFVYCCDAYLVARSYLTKIGSKGKPSHRYAMVDNLNDIGYRSETFKSGFVAIVGNPNVGKSTLSNALLRQKLCAVHRKPQTTRHKIQGIITTNDYQMIITDTPGAVYVINEYFFYHYGIMVSVGVIKPVYKLQEAMVTAAASTVVETDVLVLMSDVYGEALADEKTARRNPNTTLIVINKADLWPATTSLLNKKSEELVEDDQFGPSHISYQRQRVKKAEVVPKDVLLERWHQCMPTTDVHIMSARTGAGVEELLTKIVSMLPRGPQYFPTDQVSTRDERFFCTEAIREVILELYRDEIPHCCSVHIDKFKDETPFLSVVEAVIVVERLTQRGIVIGKGGDKLKELTNSAKLKIEQLLDRKVHLTFKVVVESGWRNDKTALDKYGYFPS